MSNQKRELQKKRREKAIRKANAKKSIRNIVLGLAVLLVVAGIGYAIYYHFVLMTRPVEDYSAGLEDNGFISGVSVNEQLQLCDYNGIQVLYYNHAPSQEEIDNDIDNLLETYKEYSTEPGVTVEMFDTINLSYVGKVDGVAFEGGTTAEGGTEIVVGEANYVDDFEAQLVGHKTGSSFDIEVTFPDDYYQAELAGKDAVFSITLNGIYVKPEFNDEFVKEHLSDTALTADAYRAYLEEEKFNTALQAYVEDYVLTRTIVLSYPESYLKKVMGIIKYDDQKACEEMNAMYYPYFGENMYASFEDYVVATKNVANQMEYEAYLRLQAEETVKNNMIIQAIFEKEGLTVTAEHLDTVLAGMGTDSEYMTQMEELYGKGYIYQLAMKEAVREYLMSNVKVDK